MSPASPDPREVPKPAPGSGSGPDHRPDSACGSGGREGQPADRSAPSPRQSPASTSPIDAVEPQALAADTEIELKLAADPAVLKRLFRSPPIAGHAIGKPKRRILDSVYWDTPDRRLAKRGMALRVRRSGKTFTQTLKAEDTRVVRGEWQAPVPGPAPDLSLVEAPAARERLGLVLPDELAPVFATRFARRSVDLRFPDGDGGVAVVEVALDEGVIAAGEAEAPIAELELELKAGRAVALWRLAAELHAIEPVRIETEAKSARGYRLASGERPRWAKAEKLVLDPADRLDTTMAEVFRHCLEHWAANEAAAADGTDPEGVHQMRVALRRLRSALILFKDAVPPDRLGTLKSETKWAADGLGPARDWDVFATELLPPIAAALPDATELAALAAAAAAERARGYERVRQTLADPRYTALVLAVGAFVDGAEWREPRVPAGEVPAGEGSTGEDPAGERGDAGAAARRALQAAPARDLADRLLARRHKTLLKKGRHFARLSSEARHEVRIAAKKLRYAAEFFRSLYKKKNAADYIRSLARLQDDLGHLNDMATARALLEGLRHGARPRGRAAAVDRAAGIVLGWYARAAEDAEPAMVADWRAFAQAAPFWKKPKKAPAETV